MISGLFTGLFVLFIYWLLWLAWSAIAPKVLSEQSDSITKPKFWQFAIFAFVISLMFKQK